jgi:hypothetical protein
MHLSAHPAPPQENTLKRCSGNPRENLKAKLKSKIIPKEN